MKTKLPIVHSLLVLIGTPYSVDARVIADWRFEYDIANPAAFYADSSGNGHILQQTAGLADALPDNSTLPSGAGSNYCAYFSGGMGLQTAAMLDLSGYQHIRVSFWMHNDLPDGIRYIMGSGTNFVAVASGIAITTNEAGLGLGLAYLTTGGSIRADSFIHNNPSAQWGGIWEFYEIEYDLSAVTDANVIKVFRNGVLVGTDKYNTGALFPGMFNEKLYLAGPGPVPFVGRLDNVKIESVETSPMGNTIVGLTDNFNVSSVPTNDQNADLSIRQTGITAPNSWEDLGTGNTQNGGEYDGQVKINASKQLEIFVGGPPDYPYQSAVIVTGQTDLPQSSQYRLKWDQGADFFWSYAGFNTNVMPATALNGILVEGEDAPGVIVLYLNGVYATQGTFLNPIGENGLHHIEVEVNNGIMTIFIDSTTPTWTYDISTFGNGKNGIGAFVFSAAPYSETGYFDNFSYEFVPPQQCGDPGTVYLSGDLSGPNGKRDCKVSFYDFVVIASNWLNCTDPAKAQCYHYWQ